MKSYYTAAQLRRALSLRLHPAVSATIEDTFKLDLQDMTHIIIVEDGDPAELVRDEIGFQPNAEEIGDFHVVHHEGLVEFICTVGNSGFAYLIFMEPMLRNGGEYVRHKPAQAAREHDDYPNTSPFQRTTVPSVGDKAGN